MSAFIEDYWLYDGYVPAHARERILPSGTFELVFNLRDDELRIYGSGPSESCRRFSGAVISGPYAGYFGSDDAEEVAVMGVHFRPGGAFPFLGFPAGDFADAHVDLAQIWNGAAESLRAQLAECASAAERFEILESQLLQHLFRPLERHPSVALALDAQSRSAAGVGTREMARLAGLSERRLIDVFRAEVGMTPKTFERVQRFQRALRRMHGAPGLDWPEVALACGYYDQSHLIRDFRQFTGISPTDYLQRMQALRAQGAHTKPNHLAFAD